MTESVFALVLAGGIGSRMGASIPKQYIEINDKPVIAYTIEAFLNHPQIDGIVVMTPSDWVDYTTDLVSKFFPEHTGKIKVAAGGKERNDTLMNAIANIEERGLLNDNTIVLTHDAVRPFINDRIISENIEAVKKYGAAVTAVSATDTIAVSTDHQQIKEIPDRRDMYQIQTPQSFYAIPLRQLFLSLSDEEKEILTDATKIYLLKGKQVHLVAGENTNIKITYPNDIRLAQTLIDTRSQV